MSILQLVTLYPHDPLEADLGNSHLCVKASLTNNKLCASFTPTYSDDHSEAISNSGNNMSTSSEEATLPEYDTDSDEAPYVCTITFRGRDGSSNITPTTNLSVPMQNSLNIYCTATTLRRAPTQGIALMVNARTLMQSINLDKSLIEHDVVCGIGHIVVVPVHSCQKLWECRSPDYPPGVLPLSSTLIFTFPSYSKVKTRS